jgi:hypothetical protein
MPAVPAAADLHNEIPLGVGAGQHHGVHRSQRSARREANTLHTGLPTEDLRHLHLASVGETDLQSKTAL